MSVSDLFKGKPKFRCSKCPMTATSERQLDTHEKSHREKPLEVKGTLPEFDLKPRSYEEALVEYKKWYDDMMATSFSPKLEVEKEMPKPKDFERVPIKNGMAMYSFIGGMPSKAKVVAMAANGERVQISMFYDPITDEVVIVKSSVDEERRT